MISTTKKQEIVMINGTPLLSIEERGKQVLAEVEQEFNSYLGFTRELRNDILKFKKQVDKVVVRY